MTNDSPDGEAIREVRVIFPEGTDVLGGSYDDLVNGWDFTFSISGDFDNLGSFFDGDGDPGEILPGQTGVFSAGLKRKKGSWIDGHQTW